MFVEYYEKKQGVFTSESEPWTLAAFKPRNEPYYDYVDIVASGLRKKDKYSWSIEARKTHCVMLGDLEGT